MLLGGFLGAAILAPGLTQAAGVCAPTDALVASVKAQFGEVPAFHGTLRDGSMLMVLIDPVDQSWTLLLKTGDGMACVLGSGDDFEAETQKPGEPS
jgi:hypothetical protein